MKVTKEEIVKVLDMVLIESNTLTPRLTEPWIERQKEIQEAVKALVKKLEAEVDENRRRI